MRLSLDVVSNIMSNYGAALNFGRFVVAVSLEEKPKALAVWVLCRIKQKPSLSESRLFRRPNSIQTTGAFSLLPYSIR
jgi:hypothetical protein